MLRQYLEMDQDYFPPNTYLLKIHNNLPLNVVRPMSVQLKPRYYIRYKLINIDKGYKYSKKRVWKLSCLSTRLSSVQSFIMYYWIPDFAKL
jgi:hypothetical protein